MKYKVKVLMRENNGDDKKMSHEWKGAYISALVNDINDLHDVIEVVRDGCSLVVTPHVNCEIINLHEAVQRILGNYFDNLSPFGYEWVN